MGVGIWLAQPGLAWPGQLKSPERAMLEIEGVGWGSASQAPGWGGDTHSPPPNTGFLWLVVY